MEVMAYEPPHKVQVSIATMYKPCIWHDHFLHEQTPKSVFAEKQQVGCKNLDL